MTTNNTTQSATPKNGTMCDTTPDESLTAQQCRHNRIVWIDCEMTGLDPQTHSLVEIAVLITDAELNILDEGIDIVVHATEDELATMDDYVTSMHASSGLTEQIRSSEVSLEEAQKVVLSYIQQFIPIAGVAPLAGNSIGTDRSFIAEYMPQVDNYLHYRMIDVSSIKELAKRWFPHIYSNQPEKGMAHRALADIRESLRELDYYRRSLFIAEDLAADDAKEAARQSTAQYPI